MSKRILLYATMNWPSAARYAGGFVAAGLEVHAACPKNALVRLSRYITCAHAYHPLAPLSSLRRAIKVAAPELIVACDDRAVAHLVRLHGIEKRARGAESPLADLIARSLGAPENYSRVISRAGSLNEVKAEGVRIPDTLAVASEQSLQSAIAAIGLPAVLKSDGSWGGEGVVVIKTHEEALCAYRKLARTPSRLRSFVRAVRRRDMHFLLAALVPSANPVSIQKFITGHPAASAFAAHEGEIVGLFHYDVVVADKTIGPPNVIRRVDDPEMDEAARAVTRRFRLSGLHGLDYIRDENGRTHLIEINPRATQGGALPFGEGRDLAAALAQTLTTKAVGRRKAIPNDVVAFFPREMRRDPSSPYIASGHHDVPRDDPEVLRAMLMPKQSLFSTIAQLIHRARGTSFAGESYASKAL